GVYHELYETQFRQAIESERGAGKRAGLDIEALSTVYDVREVHDSAVTDVHLLARSNHRYWRELGERPTMEAMTAIVKDVPEGAEEKHFLGFYDEDDELVAVMDLICGYPDKTGALIRWFTVDAGRHRQGIGSQLFADVRASLAAQGIEHLTLQVPEQEDALAFWAEQGFAATGERNGGGRFPTVTLARDI
ncbi:MAG: GNAT family N-acetyltransferase, partial [Coriobacteriaceae bacterium]|nr:GNAT family N-acetyltransferase [Coriobacteriaceae bacterium]